MKLTNESRDSWYYQNLDVKTRTIYFGPWQPYEQIDTERNCGWEVNDYSAQNLIKGLHVLELENNNPINIIWVSYGGEWDAGMAIYDYIKGLKSHVTITCYGRVRSMGTIILQAADERVLSKNCLYMMHYGSFGLNSQHTQDALAGADRVKLENTLMEDIYLEKIKQVKKRYTRAQLQDFIKYDKYLSPQEAVDLGLADRIL